MIDNDKYEFEQVMRGLAENFNSEITKQGLQFRFEALKSFSIEQVKNAAFGIVATRKYTSMPTVADFIEHTNGGSVDDKAQVEAGKVWNAISSVGCYDNVCFDDPVTQAVIKQSFGGWQKICQETMTDQQKWFIKEFCTAYGAFSRQGLRYFGEFPGVYGQRTRLVGDEARAKKVLSMANQNDKGKLGGNVVMNVLDDIAKKNQITEGN